MHVRQSELSTIVGFLAQTPPTDPGATQRFARHEACLAFSRVHHRAQTHADVASAPRGGSVMIDRNVLIAGAKLLLVAAGLLGGWALLDAALQDTGPSRS